MFEIRNGENRWQRSHVFCHPCTKMECHVRAPLRLPALHCQIHVPYRRSSIRTYPICIRVTHWWWCNMHNFWIMTWRWRPFTKASSNRYQVAGRAIHREPFIPNVIQSQFRRAIISIRNWMWQAVNECVSHLCDRCPANNRSGRVNKSIKTPHFWMHQWCTAKTRVCVINCVVSRAEWMRRHIRFVVKSYCHAPMLIRNASRQAATVLLLATDVHLNSPAWRSSIQYSCANIIASSTVCMRSIQRGIMKSYSIMLDASWPPKTNTSPTMSSCRACWAGMRWICTDWNCCRKDISKNMMPAVIQQLSRNLRRLHIALAIHCCGRTFHVWAPITNQSIRRCCCVTISSKWMHFYNQKLWTKFHVDWSPHRWRHWINLSPARCRITCSKIVVFHFRVSI